MAETPFATSVCGQGVISNSTSCSTSSPGKGFALATLSWLSPIRRPRLWHTLVGAILRPYGAGTPKSEHLHVLKSVGASELTAHNCREYNNLVAAAGTNCLVGVLAPSELERDFASARLESSRNSLINDS